MVEPSKTKVNYFGSEKSDSEVQENGIDLRVHTVLNSALLGISSWSRNLLKRPLTI